MINEKSTAYKDNINNGIQKVLSISTLIILYSFSFIFFDSNRSILHITILIISAFINSTIFIWSFDKKNLFVLKNIYLIFNNFIFLPYLFMNGNALSGFVVYFVIVVDYLYFY